MFEPDSGEALRRLLDPRAVAAWLDEVESYRVRRAPSRETSSPQPHAGGESLLTVAELSEMLRVKASWVYEMARQNVIPHVRVGRYIRFRREEIDRWLDEAMPGGDTGL